MSFQADPFLQLQTPLSDPFIVTEFAGSEAISQLFCYDIIAYSENKTISAAQLLLKPVTIQINTSQTTYYFNGIVSRFRAGNIKENLRGYSIEVMPALWQLGFTSDCRIFQHKKVSEIIQAVCKSFNIAIDTSGLKNNYKPRDYCVQYNETALHFVQRILQEEGIFYFFTHQQNQHTWMLADQTTAFKTCVEAALAYRDDDHYRDHYINYWERQYNIYSGVIAHNDYNFETPGTSLLTKQVSAPKLAVASQLKCFNYPGRYQQTADGKTLAEQHFTALEASHNIITAGSNYPGLRPGCKFNLSSHPGTDETGDYYITAVNHSVFDHTQLTPDNTGAVQSHGYNNLFVCLPAAVKYSPPQTLAKPIITGHQTAVVAGNGQAGQEINVDKYGRIQVQFHWDRENKASCSIRVAQNWAGQQWGAIFHPRIGQEVVVQFENGDPDRPIVVGSVYNAEQMPPYTLPGNHTQSGIKTHSSKNGSAAQANELRFEDKLGQEEIYLHAQKDHTRIIENNDTTTIKQGDQTIKVAAGGSTLEAAQAIELKVGSNQLVINTQGVFINGQKIKLNKS